MIWKIQKWLMNRKKKYVVFYYIKRKEIWNESLQEYEWSKIEPSFSSQILDIRTWDIKNDYLHLYGKTIWEKMGSPENKWINITGIYKI